MSRTTGGGNGDCVIAFYGDDFTGSTDALEILALAGLDPVLLLDAGAADEIGLPSTCRAVGLAGVSRSKSPAWMDAHLPAAFELLQRFGARLYHYKVCSTFDSSPEIGSIGRALEIGARHFAGGTVPVIVGAPDLGRYQAFGNLFARAGSAVHRLDRHPNMMRHSVTPMHEADLTGHLGRQLEGSVCLMDMTEIAAAAP